MERQQLEKNTQNYWKVSKVWNARIKEIVTVEQALKMLREVLQSCNPNRRIALKCADLIEDIITRQK